MEGLRTEPPYRLTMSIVAGRWNWTLLHGDGVAMQGHAGGVEEAIRAGDLAAAAHAAFARIGQRRF